MWSRQLTICRTGSTMMRLTTDLATCSSTLSSIAGRRRGKNGDRQLQSFSCCWSPPPTPQIHLSPRPSTNFPLQGTLQLNRMWKWQVARKYHACRSVPWSRVLLVSSTTTTPFHPTSFFLWLGLRRTTTSMGGENQRKEMGEGEEHKTRDDPKIEIQERGEIFFFYRPKVGREEAHSAGDVQRLYIVLRPESSDRAVEKKQESKSGKEGRKAQDDKDDEDGKGAAEGGHGEEEVNIERETLLRFMVLGRKSLPDPSKRSTPYWGFVELVTTKVDDIKEALKGEEYETSTRGHRTKPSARALAKGVYRILKHVSGRRNHTHLVYKLECPTPDKPNEPQESLNIENEASFIIQIKNPTKPAPPNVGIQNNRKATFPAQLEAQLGSKRFGPADPPDFLNYEGCEFLLIAASDHIEEELGLELRGEERWAPSSLDLINIFGESVSPKPLIEGTWA